MIWKKVKMWDGDFAYECSNCGLLWFLTDSTPKEAEMNYCPKCGERAEAEEEEVCTKN